MINKKHWFGSYRRLALYSSFLQDLSGQISANVKDKDNNNFAESQRRDVLHDAFSLKTPFVLHIDMDANDKKNLIRA